MFKYTSKHCVMGMCSERYQVLGDWQGLRKNSTTAVSFDEGFDPGFKKVNYAYVYTKPAVKASKSTQVVSAIGPELVGLAGNKWREIRETRNHFGRIVEARDYNKGDVLGLIDRWDVQSGGKYGWHRHSGYDRAFFNRWYDLEKDNLISRFYYVGAELIGYSILHATEYGYEYLIRKADNTRRNTCLYVDYKTFEGLYGARGGFLVNWGASSGGVLDYKRKFPVHSECPVYFYSVVRDSDTGA
jgi:hypothetical protein